MFIVIYNRENEYATWWISKQEFDPPYCTGYCFLVSETCFMIVGNSSGKRENRRECKECKNPGKSPPWLRNQGEAN